MKEPEGRLLGVWPLLGQVSESRAHYLASVELAGMCADRRIRPNGPQVTVRIRTPRDCITASHTLGVRTSRLMYLLEELAYDTPFAIAASVPVCDFYPPQPA